MTSALPNWETWLIQSGFRAVEHYGAPAYEPIAESPRVAGATGWVDLSHYALLEVRGANAGKFLQGYLSTELPATSERAQPCAICNLQGRMVATLNAIAVDVNTVLLRVHRSLLADTIGYFRKYAVFSKTTISDLSASMVVIGVLGPLPPGFADAPMPSWQTGRVASDGWLYRQGGRDERYELWLPATAASDVVVRSGCAATGSRAWDLADVRSGLAPVVQATSGEYLPQMFNLDRFNAVSFDKGCYLGQEIVTRTQHRGEVKRRLFGVEADGEVIAPSQIFAGQRAIGEVVFAAGPSALAVLLREPLESMPAASLTLGSPEGPAVRLSANLSYA